MKKLYTTLLVFGISFSTFSQFIGTLNISPTSDDAVVDVNMFTYTNSTSYFVSETYTINNNIITMKLCYVIIGQQISQGYNHSFPITVPADGDYTFVLNLYGSRDDEVCEMNDLSDTATLNFTTPLTETVVLSVDSVEVLGNQISVFPNPAKELLNIDVRGNLSIEAIEIYTILGNKVATVTNNFEILDLSILSNGNYFLKIFTDRGVVQKRIVVGK